MRKIISILAVFLFYIISMTVVIYVMSEPNETKKEELTTSTTLVVE